VVLASCRQGDDLVATSKVPDSGSPPVEDAIAPRADVSIERDAPLTIDSEAPRPDVAVDDVVIPPPPVDSRPPPTCEATGPILAVRRVNGETGNACAGQLAAHTFTHALCTCEDLNFAAVLSTVSFDSSAADKSPVSAGAPVGIGGNYPSARSNIGGSLTVAGTARTPTVTGGLDVRGDLRLAGRANIYTQLSVARDTWLVSNVGYWGIVTIGGNLYTGSAGSLIGIGPPPFISGAQIPTAFTVGDPCACDQRLDVAMMETLGAEKTDNVAQGIDPSALVNVTGTVNFPVPCGRFRFDSIGGPGSLQLTISGRTAIFVDGDVTLSDASQLVVVGPEAELDWFIRGHLSIGGAKIGDTNRPSATRIYAPNADVDLPALGVSGSIYGKNLTMLGGGLVRYDRAILNAGNKCGQPATCDKCNTCNGGAACKEGTCRPCDSDDDCCAPLVCQANACRPLLFP